MWNLAAKCCLGRFSVRYVEGPFSVWLGPGYRMLVNLPFREGAECSFQTTGRAH